MIMQEPIEEYPSVNEEFNSEMQSQFLALSGKLEELRANPDSELNEILAQQLRRIKANTHNYRRYQHQKIQVLGVRRRIHSLKKEVKSLRGKQSTPRRRKRTSSSQPPLQYSVLKKQLEIKNQVYEEQKRRSEMQQRHILSFKKAMTSLDQKLQNYNLSDNCTVDEKSLGIGVGKKLKLLQNRKRQLLKSRQDINIRYEEVLKQRIDRLMDIEETGLERQLLEKRINRDLDLQKQIIQDMREESGLSQAEFEPNSQSEQIKSVNKRFKRFQLKTETEAEAETPKNLYQSIQNIKPKRDIPTTRDTKTMSTEHTPSRERYINNIIIEKRRSFRSPVNLSPVVRQNYLSTSWNHAPQSQRMRNTTSNKKGSENLSRISEIKLNETSNFDVSMTASMYNKTKGIEVVSESIVDLATIKEEGRSRLIHRSRANANPNGSRQRRTPVKGAFSKASVSQTTKEQLQQYPKQQVSKGIPFEIDEPSESYSNHSFSLIYEMPRQIPKWQVRAPVSLNLQQY